MHNKSLTKINESVNGDLEKAQDDIDLYNNTVHSLLWDNISVRIYDKATKKEKQLLQGISGDVRAGEMVAIMGPSGCGKTTLLNVLAHRSLATQAVVEGDILINRAPITPEVIRRAARYVEQEDSLIGSLTARETLHFAAKLGLPRDVSKAERMGRIDRMLKSFGLQDQVNTLIGTPIRKGLSGGQKRRVGIASQLITSPKILFLDEPTSGLDSVASYEVMNYLSRVAKRNKIIVVVSIHQPSTLTLNLFDSVTLLSKGRMCYGGRIQNIGSHFNNLGFPMPVHTNPAEFLLELVNIDFDMGKANAEARLNMIIDSWSTATHHPSIGRPAADLDPLATPLHISPLNRSSQLLVPFTLLHRNFIKSYRDAFAYGMRIVMYMALAVLAGTVWFRLHTSQEYIQAFINALFFGEAFMSFMAVAYVPAYLEDRATFAKERANGLYGPTSFLVANFLIGLPYLFLVSALFAIVSYSLCNFRPSGEAFFKFIMWIFLDLIAAESLVVFIASAFPMFVVALALTAFANGLWMSVGGFLISPKLINAFWRYWARYIDYQTYVFQGLMVNEFSKRTYECAKGPQGKCTCMYQTHLADQCLIAGQGVLDQYGYNPGQTGQWIVILICISLAYRLLTWVVLRLKK